MKCNMLVFICIFLFSVVGCTQQVYLARVPKKNPPKVETWKDVDDFLYQLQYFDLTRTGQGKHDLIIMDYSVDGSPYRQFSFRQIQDLKNSPGGEKLVLAYMSIGEAEDYRWYWNGNWDKNKDGTPDPDAPQWLGPSNPDWPGNYKVKYWNKNWQKIIFGSKTSYLDMIIDAGFDGIYLDIIDAYYYWGPWGSSGLKRKTSDRDMVEFIKSMARYARDVRGKTHFGIFPQNGEFLLKYPDYLEVINGIGKESTWYAGNTPQTKDLVKFSTHYLDIAVKNNKLVLATEYTTDPEKIKDFITRALKKGYLPFVGGRALDKYSDHPAYLAD